MKIQNTKDIHLSNVKMLVYGGAGVGKTSLAATLRPQDKPIIISAETGLLSLKGSNIDYINISVDEKGIPLESKDKLAKLYKAYEWLQTEEAKKKYKTIYLDSISEIADELVNALKDTHKGFDLWNAYNDKLLGLIRSFRDISHYNVVITALEFEDIDESKMRTYKPLMPGNKVKDSVVAMFDFLFRYVVTEKGRVLVTSRTKNSEAKSRSSALSATEEPNLGLILTKIEGE